MNLARFFVFFVMSLCLTAEAFNCTWQFSDFTMSSEGVKKVILLPIAPYGVSGNILLPDKIQKNTDTNSTVTISNIVPGYMYQVTFYGNSVSTIFTNYFGTNVTGNVNAKDYFPASTNLSGGQVAYSQSASDARYDPIGSANTVYSNNPIGYQTASQVTNIVQAIVGGGVATGITNGQIGVTLTGTFNTSQFDSNGAAAAAVLPINSVTNSFLTTNKVGSAAFSSSSAFDLAGAATAVTNGFPWSPLYDPAGAASTMSNGVITQIAGSNYVNAAQVATQIGGSNLVTQSQAISLSNSILATASTYTNGLLAANGNASGLTNLTPYFTGALTVTNNGLTVAMINGNSNTYVQLKVKNYSNGSDASGDLVIEADNGDENNFYLDIGINSSGYVPTPASYPGATNDAFINVVGLSNDAQTNGGNLYITTQQTNSVVGISGGWGQSQNVQLTVTASNIIANASGLTNANGSLLAGLTETRTLNASNVNSTIALSNLFASGFITTHTNLIGAGIITNAMIAGLLGSNQVCIIQTNMTSPGELQLLSGNALSNTVVTANFRCGNIAAGTVTATLSGNLGSSATLNGNLTGASAVAGTISMTNGTFTNLVGWTVMIPTNRVPILTNTLASFQYTNQPFTFSTNDTTGLTFYDRQFIAGTMTVVNRNMGNLAATNVSTTTAAVGKATITNLNVGLVVMPYTNLAIFDGSRGCQFLYTNTTNPLIFFTNMNVGAIYSLDIIQTNSGASGGPWFFTNFQGGFSNSFVCWPNGVVQTPATNFGGRSHYTFTGLPFGTTGTNIIITSAITNF